MEIKDYFLLILFATLPFEKVLTFDVAGFTIKPPYITAIILILYFFYKILFAKQKFTLSTYDCLLIGFVLLNFMTVFWSIDKSKTTIISAMLLFSALTYFSVREQLNKEIFIKIINWIIALGVITSIFALWQFFGDGLGISSKYTMLSKLYVSNIFGFPRVQSTFFEPGFFANFLLLPIFLNVLQIEKSGRKYYLSFIITFWAFLLTLSRGGFFALIISSIILIFCILLKQKNKFKKIILIPTMLVVVSAIFAFGSIWLVSGRGGVDNYLRQSDNTKDLVEGSKNESAQNFTRNATIKIAFNNWKKNFFGIGTGAFGSLSEFKQTRELGNDRQTVNSLYPEILVEGGIQTLICFLLFITLIITQLLIGYWKEGDQYNLIFGVGLLAIFIQYSSFSTLYLVYVWVFLALGAFSLNNPQKA